MELGIAPGECVAVDFGAYRHVGIVTDAIGADGLPRVISNSRRRGGAHEEDWRTFAQGEAVYSVELRPPQLSGDRILAAARALAAEGRRYNGIWFNCEHFVRRVYGLPERSPQLRRAGFAAGAFTAIAGALWTLGGKP